MKINDIDIIKTTSFFTRNAVMCVQISIDGEDWWGAFQVDRILFINKFNLQNLTQDTRHYEELCLTLELNLNLC